MTAAEKTAVDVLRGARELIAKEGGWTQKEFARGKSGRLVHYSGKAAKCFCVLGAVYRAGSGNVRAMYGARQALEDELPSSLELAVWNDRPSRKQAEVVALFDAAIAKASAT